jgi:hypothetical protein|nr:MAG TPA: hypothetical protein [Caudoviricetes sp.]
MSQWTHVAAVFRLDSFDKISDEDIKKVFGKEVNFYQLFNYDEADDTKTLPMGSESTLKMSIWHNPDSSYMASTTVSVFGDLRDYGGSDIEKLKEWFNECCSKFMVRQAIMQVIDDYVNEPLVMQYVR